ncbi:penicillin-binding transpeptidase domain-containing protein [Clostridium sp. Ade.TY]|uniref:peptidoglycan D,D-transpeptidase FtsI family protein n=1 Tax=Clostridium sp. Ade.TY TaxID=1391647 RepID=UPI000408A5E4|nr:penicillin-binding transpeptidase domain-containing protein [Clostridium sp. Ade.TY]
MKGDIKNSVTKVMIVFLFLLIALISYMAYFQVFKAPKIAEMPGNQRAWAKRNEVLRGDIKDRDGNIIAKSVREKNNTQDREYEYGALYAHPIGYVDSRFGISGLEDAYDKQLTTCSSSSFTDLLHNFSIDNLKKAFEDRNNDKNKIGNTVFTTLDTKIQKIAYDALGDNRGAVVALNPKTGEVLASVSKPSFNPNKLASEMKKANSGDQLHSPLINRATGGLYPPGSTFKIITTTSALENIPGVTSKTFDDNGEIKFPDGRTMKNAGGASYGNIDLRKAFIVSSNVVYGTLAMQLGNDKLLKTAEGFGFNSQIPANGFNITPSKFPKLESYQIGEIAQSGIGQSSILATPMQMALAASAVANNGVIMEPQLVKSVVNDKGKTVETMQSKEYRKAMTEDQATTIKGYMQGLVDNNVKSGKWSFFDGINAAGKTGTADHNNPNGTPAEPHSWFVGFAPANNPKILVAVIVEDGGFGAGKAATVAGKVMNGELNK